MALVRVLQGPPPDRYGKHTYAHEHTQTHTHARALYTSTHFVCYTIQEHFWLFEFAVLVVPGRLHLHTIRRAAGGKRHPLRTVCRHCCADWFLSESISLCDTAVQRTKSWPAKLETPWKAMSWEWGMCPGKNIPEGGWNQNSGKRRNSTCSAKEKLTRHPLFTVVFMCICWRFLKPVDYVMLTEQGNDVYCAKQVTFSEKGCRSAL